MRPFDIEGMIYVLKLRELTLFVIVRYSQIGGMIYRVLTNLCHWNLNIHSCFIVYQFTFSKIKQELQFTQQNTTCTSVASHE